MVIVPPRGFMLSLMLKRPTPSRWASCPSFTLGPTPSSVTASRSRPPSSLSDTAALGPQTMEVTTQVQNDLDAGRPRSQYRVRGAVDTPNGDGVNDLIVYTDGLDPPTSAPSLRVVYVLAP